MTPTGIKVRCLCPSCLAEQKAEEEAKRAEAQREQIQKTLKSSCIPPRFANCTLENYIAYSDDIAYVKQNVTDFAEAFLAKQNHGENLLFVGTHGTGKTHLACALVSLAITHGFSALFTSVPEIVRRIRRTWRSIEDEDSLYRLYLSLDLLVIDEIGVQTGSENEKGIIFKILDDRYNFFKPTILISNLSLTEIRGYLGERTFDRISDSGSMALSFNWTSYRKKVQ